MKKNCKFVAMILAGAIVFQAVSPITVLADDEVTEVTEASEVTETTTSENDTKTESDTTQDETSKKEETTRSEEENNQNEIDLDKYELIDPKADEDFNKDGISDLMTKRLCDGDILTEDGKKVFGNATYLEVQSSDDFDSDGLKNGEEIIIKDDKYAVLLSDPTKVDSDNDGYNDIDEKQEDRMVYGINGGVVGSVRLVARHDESTKNPTHGHVYIVYTSYVDNLKIDVDDIYEYYVTNEAYSKKLQDAAKAAETDAEGAEITSWRSTVDEVNKANKEQRTQAAKDMYIRDDNHGTHSPAVVILNRGDYVSIGHYSMEDAKTQQIYYDIVNGIYSEEVVNKLMELYAAATGSNPDMEYVKAHLPEVAGVVLPKLPELLNKVYNATTPGGVCINRELYNQKLEYDQGPNEIVECDITFDQTRKLLDYYGAESVKEYQFMPHNCTTVTTDAWNTVFGFTTDDNGNVVKTQYYANSGIKYLDYRADLPVMVKNSIRNMGLMGVKGYVGPRKYVTGKALDKYEKSTGATPTTFTKLQMIGAIIKEKIQPVEPTPAEPTPAPVVGPTAPTNNGNNTSVSTPAQNAAQPGPVAVVTATELQLTAPAAPAALNTTKQEKKTAVTTSKTTAPAAEESVEAEDEEDVEIEPTNDVADNTKDSTKETTVISDEDAPLAIGNSLMADFPWLVIGAVVVVGIACVIAVALRKKAK